MVEKIQVLSVDEILVMDRIRKDNGDLDGLAESIKAHGLITPIAVMESEKGFVLMAGVRRLTAVKMLGDHQIRANILSCMDAEEQLKIEIEENVNRKDFTSSERVEYAEKLRAIESEKAHQRMSEHARDGYRNQGCDRGHTPDDEDKPKKERTDDVLAKKVGFKSGRQLHRATYVAKTRPDLMEQVDNGEKTITGAYEEAKGISRRKKPAGLPSTMGIIHGMVGHIGTEFTRPDGFAFVLSEIETAAKYYLDEIRAAASHYTEAMQSPSNSAALSQVLRDTFNAAADAFGSNYIEER